MLRFLIQQIARAANYHTATPSQPKAAWYHVDTSSNQNWRAKYVDYSLKDQNASKSFINTLSQFYAPKHQKVFTWFFSSRVFLIWSTAACEILFFLKCNTFSGGVQVISDVAPVSSIKLAFRSILSNCLKTK